MRWSERSALIAFRYAIAMGLYTGSGDDGTTGLFGGERVGKDHPRVEAYGTVDELNACLGLAAACCSPTDAWARRLLETLGRIQSRLFDIGADLATPPGSKHEERIERVSADHVREAETWIDGIDSENEPLREFILPGGSPLAAQLHLARAVCRRAERQVVRLAAEGPLRSDLLAYLNRLSDLLFTLARAANVAAGVPEVTWQKDV